MSQLIPVQARFALSATAHQVANRSAGFFSIVQYGIHLLADRHFNGMRSGQTNRGIRGQHAFGNHAMHSGNDVS